jgi:NAD(P)H-flavin reductase
LKRITEQKHSNWTQDPKQKTQSIKPETGHWPQNTGPRTLDAQPGQFLMFWLPGIGERPMGIADDNPLTISVVNVGKVTAEMHKLKKGDLLSFRGPFGKGFEGKKELLLTK